jgi:hypothetical protein
MEAQLDPITDIFRTLHVTAFGLHRLEATAPWGVKQENQTEEKATLSGKKMPPTDLAHFAMLSRGNCWLSVEGIAEQIPLTGGDCFLVAKGTSIVLRDSPRTRPGSTFREIGAKANGNVALYGGGGAPTTIVCGSLSFDRASLKPITQLLPSFILMKADEVRTLALHNTVQALASEMAEQAPGSEVVATRLAEVLFIQVLRAHIASGPARKKGWLRAIFDPQIGAARLSSVGLIAREDAGHTECPVCHSHLAEPVPTAQQIDEALQSLSVQLEAVEAENPRLLQRLASLEQQAALVQERLQENQSRIAARVRESELMKSQQDTLAASVNGSNAVEVNHATVHGLRILRCMPI